MDSLKTRSRKKLNTSCINNINLKLSFTKTYKHFGSMILNERKYNNYLKHKSSIKLCLKILVKKAFDSVCYKNLNSNKKIIVYKIIIILFIIYN